MGFLPRATRNQLRPTVSQFMTPDPHSISADMTMAQAHEVMREFEIRHLPVVRDGATVGVVSLRDLHLLETLRDVDPVEVPVADAMTPDPYTVTPHALLHEVAATMVEQRIGSVLVARGSELLGIFTTTDALAALVRMGK